jgi:pyruvate,orthophosphate dikinase
MEITRDLGRKTRPRSSSGFAANTAAIRERQILPSPRLNYVSCSPFRVPIAKLAAAQAALGA